MSYVDWDNVLFWALKAAMFILGAAIGGAVVAVVLRCFLSGVW